MSANWLSCVSTFSAVALVALFPTIASAQLATCRMPNGTILPCNAYGQPSVGPDWSLAQPPSSMDMTQSIEEGAELGRKLGHEAMLRKAGALVAAGRCVEARNLALRDGDFETAAVISRQCEPSP